MPDHQHRQTIKVYCHPKEHERIKAQASASGKSVSSFLLHVGLGIELRSLVDQEQVLKLARINADLGRLGGLLKMWLTDDARVAKVGVDALEELLSRINARQEEMRLLMRSITRPQS